MAAVRTQLEKVKLLDSGGPEENKDETSSQGSKRKRDMSVSHPITDALEEVQKAVYKTKESDYELEQFLGSVCQFCSPLKSGFNLLWCCREMWGY